MKNFTNNFKQFTSRLSARWLIMALILLLGTSSAWAAHGFFDGLKVGYYTASTGNVYTLYGTSTLNELKGDLYLKLLAVKTYDSGVTSVTIEVKEGNTVLISRSDANFKSSWSDNWNKEWELVTDTKLPSTLGTHNISVIAKTNNSTSVTYSLTYTIISDDPCPDGVIYRVAGNYSEITSNDNWCNGKKWDPEADENKMTCNEGIYTITYNNLPANTGDQQYAFKVVKNGNWGTAYPGSNYTFKLTEASNVTITFNSSTNTVSHTLTKSCNTADFSVNTLSDLAVDCTATASITGDNVTVTWSSSETSVASIDPNTGVITANAAGETTITATTTDANGFCAGVVKETTLTVNSPSVLVEANKTSLCAGEELILIATVTNAGTGNTYQWYKGDNSISGATSATYTINSVSTDDAATYKVAVSGGILCQAKESAGVTVAVNALPSAPTDLGSATICKGAKTTLPTVTGSWYTDATTPTPLASISIEVNPAETTSYFATAKENGCESSSRTEYVVKVKSLASANNYELTKTTAVYTGTAVTLQISDVNVNNNAGAVVSVYFKQDGNIVDPINVGDYEVYVTTAATEDICAGDVMIGTFTITCPAPAEVPKFEVTQHEVVCGNTNIQKGIIKITNPVANYKYRLGNEVNTEYTLDANNSITGIDGGTKYRISAVRYCGTAKSSTTNEEEYAEISKTDVKLTPTLTSTPIVKCGEGDNAYTPGTLVITNYNADYNYAITPSVGTPTIDGTNATYSINAKVDTEYTVIATHKEYNCSSVQAKTTVALTDNTPTLEEISISSNVQIVCAGDNNVTLTCNLVNPVGTPSYKWFKNGVEIVGETSNLIPAGTLNENTTFSVAVILDNNGCTKEFNAEKLIEVKVRPEAPNLGAEGTAICKGATVDLPMVDQNNNSNQINWYNEKLVKPTNVSVLETTTFYAEAVSENGLGCPSNDRTSYTVTVNPLPTISIDGNDEAVKYEDVTLTATATNAETITWAITSGTGTLSSDTGESVKLTSNTKGTVKVKATATSTAGCSTTSSEKSVEFVEEDCSSTTKTEQQKVGKAKITCTQKPNDWTKLYCYIWTAEDKKPLGAWPGTEISANTAKIVDVNSKTFHVIFHNGSGVQTANSQELNPDKIYNLKINYSNNSHTISVEDKGTYKESVTVTVGPDITAPAVKITSAVYNENTGMIDASGAVYKTGCGEVEWGFQYSTDGTTWNDNNKVYPTTHKTNTVGAINHTFEIPGANGGDIYYIRAYAKNSHSEVPSEISIPVEIPSSTIESATISLVDSEGKLSTNSKVCPQSTVYLRVDYTGGDYKEFEATENFPGTNLVEVTRNKLDNYAIFSFTATSAGTANITISNNNSSVTPATGVAITLKDVETITTPAISMDPASGMICSDGEATITIYEPNVNYTYALYKDSELADDESKGSYTVNEAGSYTVVATESVCGTSASSMAIELKVVSSDVKINLVADPTTTSPWQPIKLTVTPPAGYDYTLEGINDVEYTQNGDVYTVKIPRPKTWQAGNSGTTLKTANKIFTAKIKVSDTTSCGSKSVTVKLTDTEENCQ